MRLDCALVRRSHFIGNDQVVGNDQIIAATRRWLERSVIGLNLCPFAESVYRGNRVRFRVSEQARIPGR